MSLKEKFKKIVETFLITFLSTSFGFLGAHLFSDNFLISSLFSGIGGVFALFFFIPFKTFSDSENTIKKSYGPWTQGIREECLRFKRKVRITFIRMILLTLLATSTIFYCVEHIFSDYTKKNETPMFVSLILLIALFVILHVVMSETLNLKIYRRQYRKYKNACKHASEGL